MTAALEVLVGWPDAGGWLLLSPTLLQQRTADGSEDPSTWPISLELRMDAHYQSLGLMTTCGELAWTDYLRWAGDLDGDGRPDLLVQLNPAAGGEGALILSSLAASDQFVGAAGRENGGTSETRCP